MSSVRRIVITFATAAVLAGAAAVAGCGSSDEGGADGASLKWYVFAEPSGAFAEAAKRCTTQAKGKYSITIVDLPTNADQQRELVVRRLAAKDSDIDIIGMDVIWTAEFAGAKWIRPWTGAGAAKARAGVIRGPLRTAEYKGKLWAAPFTTNTQLLWYRKDRVKTPPKTWDEMIKMAEKIGADGKIQVQGARYEGLVVWFNSLNASAGGTIVNEKGDVTLGPAAEKAAAVMRRLARSSAADPSLSNNREDQARLAFQNGGSSFQINYTFVWPSAQKETPKIFKQMGYAPYPGVVAGKPGRAPIGGINLGVAAYSTHQKEAFAAALCLRQPANQITAAEKGGLAPTAEALYTNAKIKKAFPFSALLRRSLETGAPRPVSPAYSDISLAIQRSLHPPQDIDPKGAVATLRDRLDKAAQGKIF